MYSELFFKRAASAIKENGARSQHGNSWTVGIPHLQMIFEDLLRREAQQALPSYSLILEEGERRGFWEVNNDHEYVADLVVIRLLIDGD
jgi:hypothetical protein